MEPKFYINEGRRCAQTAIKMVATQESISLKKLDQLTGRKPTQISVPIQIAYALQGLGIDFYYPVKPLFKDGSIPELIDETLKVFGPEILAQTNLDFIEKAWRSLQEKHRYSLDGKPSLSDEISFGRHPICLINYDIFVRRENKNNGHYLVLLELEKDIAKIMDSGPCNANPNLKISRKRLEDSLMETPLDYGLIFV